MSEYEDEDEYSEKDYDDERDYDDSDVEDEDDYEDDDKHNNEEDKDVKDDDEFVVSFKQMEHIEERKGFSRQNIIDKRNWRGRMELTDQDNFSEDLDIFYSKIKTDIKLNSYDFDRVNDLVDITPNIKYKNPGAFLMGYLCSIDNGEKNIDSRKLKSLTSIVKGYDINMEDIIRYTRLIKGLTGFS